jgi:ribonuclease E
VIIEPTEALTVVDVNSGSFTRSNTSRETVLWTNCEAATEIARQLRLRNIAGVIIIDFIDMDYRKDQLQVLEHFNKQLRVDKARPQIAQLSELGLVELTRKRQGQNIYELFGATCTTCGGLGHLAHVPGETVYGVDGEIVPISLVSHTPQREYRSRSSDSKFPSSRGLARSGPRRHSSTPESRQPARAASWDPFASDGAESGEDFNLVNHPSYQEQNGVGKKRRRRIRDREEEGRNIDRPTPANDINRSPITDREPQRGTRGVPIPEVRNANRDSSPTPARGNLSTANGNSAPSLVIREFVPPELEAFVPELTPADIAEEFDRDRPNKPQRVKPTRPTIEPPEVVEIEMSDLEKETYAWMGISPLVKLGKELKNPKTAIVSIVPIGSLPPEPIEQNELRSSPQIDSELVADELDEPEPELELPSIEPPILGISPDNLTIPIATEEFSPADAESFAIESESPAAETIELVEVSASGEDAVEIPENRRRKRRSSAHVD